MLKDRPILRAMLIAAIAALLAALGLAPIALGADPETRVVVPLRLTTTAAPASAVQLRHGSSACSGTVIASEGEYSLVITCNHCFADRPSTDGRYPQDCTILTLDGKATYPATAVIGRAKSDMALIVVRARIAPALIDGRLPEVGTTVEHWGICSTHTTGKVRKLPEWSSYNPTDLFRSDCRSCPGDSGAGVFRDGKLVAVNWGYWSGGEQAGTPIAYVGGLVRESAEVRERFPVFAKGFPGGVPPVVTPPVTPPVPPVVTPPVTPPEVWPVTPPCPPSRPALFPRILPRVRGLR